MISNKYILHIEVKWKLTMKLLMKMWLKERDCVKKINLPVSVMCWNLGKRFLTTGEMDDIVITKLRHM